MFIVTAQTGPYAVASDEQRRGWVVVEQETHQAVAPARLYRTAIDALHAAIDRAARECQEDFNRAEVVRG